MRRLGAAGTGPAGLVGPAGLSISGGRLGTVGIGYWPRRLLPVEPGVLAVASAPRKVVCMDLALGLEPWGLEPKTGGGVGAVGRVERTWEGCEGVIGSPHSAEDDG